MCSRHINNIFSIYLTCPKVVVPKVGGAALIGSVEPLQRGQSKQMLIYHYMFFLFTEKNQLWRQFYSFNVNNV